MGISTSKDKVTVHKTYNRNTGYAVSYPEHETRVSSPLYNKTHRTLCITNDIPCLICGIKKSDGINMETHHFFCEYSMINGIDWIEFGRKAQHLYNPQSGFHIGSSFNWKEVAKDPSIFVDSMHNMIVLCPTHHRMRGTGIHHTPFPDWFIQIAPKKGFVPIKTT